MVTPLLGGVDHFGGIPASVSAYTNLIGKMGAEVDIVAGIRVNGIFNETSRWTRAMARLSTRLGWCNGRELLRCIQGVRWADVVIVHAWFHVLARLASWLAVKAQKPWILVPHGTLMEPARRHHAWKKRLDLAAGGERLIRSATLAFVASEVEEQCSRPYLPSRSLLVPPPVKISASYPRRGEADDRSMRIGFLGRFHQIKRIDLMLDACRQSAGTRSEFDLVLAGPDEGNLIGLLMKQYGDLFTSGRACWKGPVNGADKHAFLAEIDALILASSFESYGMVILEAWAQGTPCLVTPNVGLANVVGKHRAGIILSDCSSDAILCGVRDLQVALRSERMDRTALRALAIEHGERNPASGFLRGMQLCGYSMGDHAEAIISA